MANPRRSPVAIEESTALAWVDALVASRASSVDLVRASLERIAAVDRGGPRLNSVIELNPDAVDLAGRLDAERRAGHPRGPLHGLPVLLKDNIATGDRMCTTAGSLALEGVRAVRDAGLVARLRAAGLVIVGKTNLSEWANFRSTRSTSGWSARGGLTRNPYALDRSTSGSSSGSAAAVAASLVPFAVGTETDGSIVSPASINGIVGLKPTVGRVSGDGIVPISHSQDTAGPMARNVTDVALLFLAMAEPHDAAPSAPLPSWSAGAPTLPRDALHGARLGVAAAYRSSFDEVDAVFAAAVDAMRAAGATVIDDVELPLPDYRMAERRVLLHEFKHGLAAWLDAFAPHAPVRSLADVIALNAAHRATEMPWFGQELFEMADAVGGLDDPAYVEARAACVRGARTEGLDRAFDRFGLDAVIAPTGGVAWLIDPIAGDHASGGFAGPAAVAGVPHLTVPAGFVRGLPTGLSFVGRPWSEWRLLELGFAFEQLTRHRRPPTYRKRSVPP